jgi:hypothetical protein
MCKLCCFKQLVWICIGGLSSVFINYLPCRNDNKYSQICNLFIICDSLTQIVSSPPGKKYFYANWVMWTILLVDDKLSVGVIIKEPWNCWFLFRAFAFFVKGFFTPFCHLYKLKSSIMSCNVKLQTCSLIVT